MKNVTAGFKALSATPAIAILGLLANILSEVVKAMKSSEEGVEGMTAAFGVFSGIGTMTIGESATIKDNKSLSVNLVGEAQTVLIGNWDEMADVLRKVMSEMK